MLLITPILVGKIEGAIEQAIGEYDFNDTGNYELEYELDYDNRIYVSNIDLNNACELGEMVCRRVFALFTETECSKDD